MSTHAQPAADIVRPRRTALHALAETRGLLGGHVAASRPVTFETDDGVALRASLLPGPSAPAGPGPAVVLLHGFAAHRLKPRYAWLADELATRLTVLSVDQRGHGQSAGVSGLGASEASDVRAAVGRLREAGHPWVAVVGVSMGATSTVTAAAAGVAMDAAVLISGPGWIEMEPTTAPMQRLRRVWHAPGGRAALRGVIGVRIADHRGWQAPAHPADAAGALPNPTLVVHGEDDLWFPRSHADALVAGHGDATDWREPGFGHAEDGFWDPFGRRLALALRAAYTSGRFPDRQELLWPV